MDELDKDFFPEQCHGCYENCYQCVRKLHGVNVAIIRRLAATRKLKQQAVARMQRDIEKIENQLYTWLKDD